MVVANPLQGKKWVVGCVVMGGRILALAFRLGLVGLATCGWWIGGGVCDWVFAKAVLQKTAGAGIRFAGVKFSFQLRIADVKGLGVALAETGPHLHSMLRSLVFQVFEKGPAV